MPGRVRNAAVLLVSAAYLSAVTAGGWFHTHGGPAACCDLPDRAVQHSCGHGHDHDDDRGPGGPAERPVSAVAGADSCAVCQFLAQKPVPAEISAPPASAPRVESTVAVRPLGPALSPGGPWRIRAPPSRS
jgi:hypothetical protein